MLPSNQPKLNEIFSVLLRQKLAHRWRVRLGRRGLSSLKERYGRGDFALLQENGSRQTIRMFIQGKRVIAAYDTEEKEFCTALPKTWR